MRFWLVFALVGIVCGVFGYAIGEHASRPDPSPGPAATPAAAVEPPSPTPRRPLVCATRRPHSPGGDTNCEAEELRARWCETELEQCRGERKAVRKEWPDDAEVESPDQWANAVEEALVGCELGAQLELIDCSEYPCTAALRPASPPASPEAFVEEMERLMGAARGCAPLREAFGIEEQSFEALDIYRLDAPCDGSREEFFVLMALDPAGPAYELLTLDRDDTQERDFNRWLYRRADDLSAMWPCG